MQSLTRYALTVPNATQNEIVGLLVIEGGVPLSLTEQHPMAPEHHITPGEDIIVRFPDGEESTLVVRADGGFFGLPNFRL